MVSREVHRRLLDAKGRDGSWMYSLPRALPGLIHQPVPWVPPFTTTTALRPNSIRCTNHHPWASTTLQPPPPLPFFFLEQLNPPPPPPPFPLSSSSSSFFLLRCRLQLAFFLFHIFFHRWP